MTSLHFIAMIWDTHMTHNFRMKAMQVLEDFRFHFIQNHVVISQAIELNRCNSVDGIRSSKDKWYEKLVILVFQFHLKWYSCWKITHIENIVVSLSYTYILFRFPEKNVNRNQWPISWRQEENSVKMPHTVNCHRMYLNVWKNMFLQN